MIYLLLITAIGVFFFLKTILPKKRNATVFLITFATFFVASTLIKVISTDAFSTKIILKGNKLSEASEETINEIQRTSNVDIETIRRMQKTGEVDIISPFEYLTISISKKLAEFLHPITDLLIKERIERLIIERDRKENAIETKVPVAIRSTIVYIVCNALGETIAIFIVAGIIILIVQLLRRQNKSTANKNLASSAS